MAKATSIRVGIGGWTYEPWRDNFYPKGLAQAKELEYASRQLSAIEVNGTSASFKKWHDDTPDDFVFSLKASDSIRPRHSQRPRRRRHKAAV